MDWRNKGERRVRKRKPTKGGIRDGLQEWRGRTGGRRDEGTMEERKPKGRAGKKGKKSEIRTCPALRILSKNTGGI